MRLRAIPCLVGLVALAMGPLAEAKTFRWVNDQGIVTYSDQPPQVRPVEGEREALINEALDISGTKKALETIPAHIRAQFEARQTPLKPEEKARVVKILGDAFRTEVLYGAVRGAFRTRVTVFRSLSVEIECVSKTTSTPTELVRARFTMTLVPS